MHRILSDARQKQVVPGLDMHREGAPLSGGPEGLCLLIWNAPGGGVLEMEGIAIPGGMTLGTGKGLRLRLAIEGAVASQSCDGDQVVIGSHPAQEGDSAVGAISDFHTESVREWQGLIGEKGLHLVCALGGCCLLAVYPTDRQ